ncbi:MAG: ATP12 family chaperone protein [Polymorphobacter sp.]
MKRFYKTVAVTDSLGIALDGKPVRTPARTELQLPTRALAQAVAAEWDAQAGAINPEAMVLTGLANAAIDRIEPVRSAYAQSLAAYAESDLLCYRAEAPPALVARQSAAWDPWLAWATARYDVAFAVTAGIIHSPQPPATCARLAAAYAGFDAVTLAALSAAVTITGSAVLGLAFGERCVDSDTLWQAGELDEIWQAEQWGLDPLAIPARAARQRSLAAAETLLELLR